MDETLGEFHHKMEPDDIDAQLGKFRLTATVVHSGTATSGHYRAFIRGDRMGDQDSWYNFNDAGVYKLNERDVMSMYGRNNSIADETGPGHVGATKIPSQKSEGKVDEIRVSQSSANS